jgi:hypothetical protein
VLVAHELASVRTVVVCEAACPLRSGLEPWAEFRSEATAVPFLIVEAMWYWKMSAGVHCWAEVLVHG